MMENLYTSNWGGYINGNYYVITDGSKLTKTAFRINEDLIGDFPDSIDLKISNKCFWNCPYCHENSTKDGKIFNLEKTKQILEQLPKVPIEIAIGGGNVFESPEETLELIQWLKANKFRPRITINWKDVKRRIYTETSKTPIIHKILLELEAIGVSIDNFQSIEFDETSFSWESASKKERNIITTYKYISKVYHVIAGVISNKDLEQILNYSTNYHVPVKLLILGFKQFGRAKDMKLPESIKELESIIKRFIYNCRTYDHYRMNQTTLGFDNLAIEQLHIKDCLLPEEYNKIYLGDEGKCSMYIDAVNGEFARTSRSTKRISWDEIKLLDFFKELKNDTSDF